MDNDDARGEPRFFFSLPRLMAKLRGGSAARSDKNWFETNAVGTAMHAIVYVCGAHWLLIGKPVWLQLLLLVPLAVLLCLWWMIFFSVSSRVIKLLRVLGLFRSLPDARVQGVFAGIMVTAFAWRLVVTDSPFRLLGWIWLVALSLNLIAALVLAFTNADDRASA